MLKKSCHSAYGWLQKQQARQYALFSKIPPLLGKEENFHHHQLGKVTKLFSKEVSLRKVVFHQGAKANF